MMERKLHSTEESAQRTAGGCFIDSPVSSKSCEREGWNGPPAEP